MSPVRGPERQRLEASIERLQRATELPTGPAARPPLEAREGAPPWSLPALVGVGFAVIFAALLALRRGPLWLALVVAVVAVLAASWWRRGRAQAGAGREAPGFAPDDELRRVERTLAAIAESLERAPAPVRELAPDANRALLAIAEGARTLARRGFILSQLLQAQDPARAEQEHQALLRRREASADPATRQLLEQAAAHSELKRKKLLELARHQERLGAERLRIRHAVEALHLDIERAIAANVEQSEARMAESFSRLTDEISAVADALEALAHDEPSH